MQLEIKLKEALDDTEYKVEEMNALQTQLESQESCFNINREDQEQKIQELKTAFDKKESLYKDDTLTLNEQINSLKNRNISLTDLVQELKNAEVEKDLNYSEKMKSMEEELTIVNKELESKLKALENFRAEVEALNVSESRMLVKQTQTKSVIVTASPLSQISQKCDDMKVKFPEAGASEILHRSIKNLKVCVSSSKIGEDFKCSIKVEAGKGIMGFQNLLSFEATGVTEVVARSSAFDILMSNILQYEQQQL